MNNIKTMKMALEALESSRVFVTTREKIKHPEGIEWYDQRIAALRQAVEQAQQAEPVAWVSAEELLVMKGNALAGAKDWRINVGLVKQDGDVGLYTSPPPRQPLTDEEIKTIFESNIKHDISDAFGFARAIEAAHGIKENT